MKKVLLASLALLFLAFFALPAMATFSSATLVTESGGNYNIDGLLYSDNVTLVDLFRPVSSPLNPPPAPTSVPVSPDLWWDNNRARVFDGSGNYPDGVPSPAYSAAGESFDIEGVFWQYSSNTLKVWVVTSVAPDGTLYPGPTSGYYYHLGDVFLNTDGDSLYEYALLSFGVNPGLAANHDVANVGGDVWGGTGRDAGALVTLTSPDYYGINGPNSYAGSSGVEDDTNPWALENPGTLPASSLQWDYVNDNLNVNSNTLNTRDGTWATGAGTYVYLWTVGITLNDAMIDALSHPGSFHVSVQCGNDSGGNSGGPGGGNNVPVPGALILGIIGAGLVGLRRRMKA